MSAQPTPAELPYPSTTSPPNALEVIDKGACTPAHPAPLLFVHGAWHGAWCWDQHFLDFFAGNGYRALAVSLRGHGQSALTTPLRSCTIADYIEDVATAADTLEKPPVVIGHSMGGLVVQKYLESHHAPAGALLASLPPRGLVGNSLRFARRHPLKMLRCALTGNTLRNVSALSLAREMLFSSGSPESVVVECAARLQEESRRAIFLDMLALNLPKPSRVSAPLLVMGAREDGSVSTNAVYATAHAYRTAPILFPGMGHNMMLEPGWQAVAERIHTWLGARGL